MFHNWWDIILDFRFQINHFKQNENDSLIQKEYDCFCGRCYLFTVIFGNPEAPLEMAPSQKCKRSCQPFSKS